MNTQDEDVKRMCYEAGGKVSNIGSLLFDYRIELMNNFMEDVFDKRVPDRKPLDPNIKILGELAIKNEVEEECRKRELAMYKGNRATTQNTKKSPL